jgi:hypothetical protein
LDRIYRINWIIIMVSRLSSRKPGKKYPGNPVDPVKKTILK